MIRREDALVCAETSCGAIFSQREYPQSRCPVCRSEAVLVEDCELRAQRAIARWASCVAMLLALEERRRSRPLARVVPISRREVA